MKKTITMFILAGCIAFPAQAQETVSGEYASARFISDRGDVDKIPTTGIALDIDLKDGWYTYWRMAGDNGLPPKFDWSGSTNVKRVDISWPAPSRFSLMDMHSFGYSDRVVLPLEITPENPGLPIELDLKLAMVVCHEICVPENLHIHGSSAAADKATYDAAEKQLPMLENTDQLGITAAVLSKDALVITAYAEGGFDKSADVIVETPSPLLTVPPQILIDEENPERAVLKIPAPAGLDLTKTLFGKEATILLLHGGKAVEKNFSF